jgi:hypothetical protein
MSARVGRAAASVGLVASALAHLASFTPLAARVPDAAVIVLFAGALALLVVMLARLRGRVTARPWRRLQVYDWRELGRRVPPPLRGLIAATAAYAVLNFGLSLLAEAGALRVASGQGLLFYLIPLVYFRHVEPTLS